MTKRTTEDVRKYFEEQGCELLNEYTHSQDKLEYKCRCGKISTTVWSNFKKGHRCGFCVKSSNKKKRSLEEVKQIFQDRNCEFLDNEFKNSNFKHNYKCKCGVVSKITFAAFFRQNQHCYQCGLEKIKQKQKLSLEEVKKIFSAEKCELLEAEYHGSNVKMNYKCECGRNGLTDLDHFRRGHRCGFCGLKGRNKKYSINEVKEIFEKRGYKFLDNEFKGSEHKHNYQCKCGAIGKITLTACRKNKNCDKCRVLKKGEKAHNWIKDRKQAKLNNSFRKKCYKALEHTYNMIGGKKTQHTRDILGYSPKDLQFHITSHPNWSQIKETNWHLDHIFPIAAFIEFSINDVKLINCLENLQPLSEKDNLNKSYLYNKEDFKNWLKSKNVKYKDV